MSNKTGSCNACGNLVSKNAKSCPHCGESKPYGDNSVKIFFWVVLTIVLFYMLFGGNSDNNADLPKNTEIETCRQNFKLCTTEDELGNNYWSTATVACERLVKEITNYGEPDFPTRPPQYTVGRNDKDKNTIILSQDNIWIPNMYGGKEKIGMLCQYNLANSKVIKLLVEQNGQFSNIEIEQ